MINQPIILFDGVCNFCNSTVNIVIRKDKKKLIKFSALQSNTGKELLLQYGLPVDKLNSFVFIENGKAYTKSTGALIVCKYLSGVWPLLYGFIIVPSFVRNVVYDFIAKNRYKWFGVQQQCMIPTPEVKERFLP